MAGPISAAYRLGNTAPKKRCSGGEPLATLLTGPRVEAQTYRANIDVLVHYPNQTMYFSGATCDQSKASALSDLTRLLSSINNYDGKEKKRLFNQVVSAVQEFCNNEGVNIELKIEVLQLLRKVRSIGYKYHDQETADAWADDRTFQFTSDAIVNAINLR